MLRLVTGDDELVRSLAEDWRSADLDERLRAILAFSEKLTIEPDAMRREDHGPLRDAGLDDRGILEVVEVTAYFAFVNRLADGLGVCLEESYR